MTIRLVILELTSHIHMHLHLHAQCSIQTWYLAAEMQLHIIGFILLLAYLRGPRLAYLASGLLVVLGVILIVIVISSGLTPLSLFHIFTYTEYP